MDSFEDYLKEQHMNEFPEILDDDLPDHYDDWVGSLDAEDFIRFADLYGNMRAHNKLV